MLMDAAATRPWKMALSQPPSMMGRQAAKKDSPWVRERSSTLPLSRPVWPSTRNSATKPYRPWVPGSTCRIRHLVDLSGSSLVNPAAASPTIPVPLAEPMQHRPAVSAAPRMAKPSPPTDSRKANMI